MLQVPACAYAILCHHQAADYSLLLKVSQLIAISYCFGILVCNSLADRVTQILMKALAVPC